MSLPRSEALAIIAKALGVEQDELMPPHGVPFVGDRPAFQMQSAGEGRVFLSINRTMTMALGMKIALMLSEEGKEGTGPQAN